mgnify:CR=1 FL=1
MAKKSNKNQNTVSIKTGALDPRWSGDVSGKAFRNLDKPRSDMPKFIQGATYLYKSTLTVIFKYKTDSEYDPIADIVDKDETRDLSTVFTKGTVTLTYKNYKSKTSKDKEFLVVFGSGFTKRITLKIPGLRSRLADVVENTTSTLTSAPYQNFLSLEFSDSSKFNTTILGAVYAKADPYNVFNYSGVFSQKLPYAYYINSVDINEVLVDANVRSSNQNVESGNSTRGVGNIYPGFIEQEVHFINAHLNINTENPGITNNNLLLNVSGALFIKSPINSSEIDLKLLVALSAKRSNPPTNFALSGFLKAIKPFKMASVAFVGTPPFAFNNIPKCAISGASLFEICVKAEFDHSPATADIFLTNVYISSAFPFSKIF